jgi:hypothetical protein
MPETKSSAPNNRRWLFKNGNLLRQRKNPGRLCIVNTPRGLDFFASLHLTIFERPVTFDFFKQSGKLPKNSKFFRQTSHFSIKKRPIVRPGVFSWVKSMR